MARTAARTGTAGSTRSRSPPRPSTSRRDHRRQPDLLRQREGPGSRTRFREVENGIFSANAVKAEDTKLIAFGWATESVTRRQRPEPARHLRTTPNTDYFQTSDYATAGAQLGPGPGQLPRVDHRGQAGAFLRPPPPVPRRAPTAGGWTFTGAGARPGSPFDAPSTRSRPRGTGAANFPLTFTGGTTSGTVTLTETQQAGYTLHQVTGQNAVCTRLDTGATCRRPTSGNGFTVAATRRTRSPAPSTTGRRAPGRGDAEQELADQRHRLRRRQSADRTDAGPTINGTAQAWGVERTGFRLGDHAGGSTSRSATSRSSARSPPTRWCWPTARPSPRICPTRRR